MSDTPRTDAWLLSIKCGETVNALDFARTLERETVTLRKIARELLDMQHSREQLAKKGLEEYERLLVSPHAKGNGND